MRRDKQVGGSVQSPEVQEANPHEAQPPLGFFIFRPMAKRPPLLPRAQSLTTRLQLERQKLKALIYGDKLYPQGMDRAQAVARLKDVERELNQLYAANR